MTSVLVILLVIWVLYSGWRFYMHVNWDEPAVSTPDMGELHKREAELLHIQGFLEDARAQGKLSQGLLDEFNRYYEAEVSALHAAAIKR
jgi:hypothetical protein